MLDRWLATDTENQLLLQQEAATTHLKGEDDQDVIDTTDQGSGSDNEGASSKDSISACWSDSNTKVPKATESFVAGLAPLCSRRSQLRGLGHGILERISSDAVEQTTQQNVRQNSRLKPKVEEAIAYVSAARKVKSSHLVRGLPASTRDFAAECPIVALGACTTNKVLEPAKVMCEMAASGKPSFNPLMPLKKQPLFREALPLMAKKCTPMKKRVSSFLFEDPPTVLGF
mmetsp:Transcript_51024/g.94394  ORF Transcript_51024/g.94394 Transcript_51024/m.94394 type:complete len:229 (-) Transcript_51024:30-716(-)